MRGSLVGRLATGEAVHDKVEGSHFATHSAANPELSVLVAEVLGKVNGGVQFTAANVDLGRVVGVTSCVPTELGDDIVFAQRPNRFGLTRFVRNRQPEKTSFVSVILLRRDYGYELVSAWVGELAPPEPWDRRATAESVPFWSTHALVWGIEKAITGTETSVCPW